MAEITKIGEGKSFVTRDQTTLHGLTNATTDSTRNEITLFTTHSSLLIKFEEITNNYGTANAKELGDYFLANNFFFRCRS